MFWLLEDSYVEVEKVKVERNFEIQPGKKM